MAHRPSASSRKVSRRGVLKRAAGAAAAVSITVGAAPRSRAQNSAPQKAGFVLCLNTSTIRERARTLTDDKQAVPAHRLGGRPAAGAAGAQREVTRRAGS